MSRLAPRAREVSVRPRRLAGVGGRPLNFTVRPHVEVRPHSLSRVRSFCIRAFVCEFVSHAGPLAMVARLDLRLFRHSGVFCIAPIGLRQWCHCAGKLPSDASAYVGQRQHRQLGHAV